MLRQKLDWDCPLLCCSFLPLTCKQDLGGQANGKSQTSGCLKGSLGPHACPRKLDGEIWGSMDSLAGLVLCGVSLLLSGKVWLYYYYFFFFKFFLTVTLGCLTNAYCWLTRGSCVTDCFSVNLHSVNGRIDLESPCGVN